MALVYFLPFLAHLLLSANTIHGFFDNMTIWTANNGFMYSSQTSSWLSGNIRPTSTHIAFNDTRMQLKGVACHVAWKYLIFSDTGTQTLLLVLPSLNAVYAYTGTSPKIGHVAVDWLSNNMYWADGGFGWIGLQALKSNPGLMATNGRLKVIVSSLLDQPQGLAVLPLQRRIFWTDSGSSPKIESADLLGGNRRVLVWQGVSKPTAISVDTESTRLYWVDEFKETIESCDMLGVNRRLLTYLKGSVMGGLQVFEKYIIVTEREKSHIRAINKETGIEAANAIQNASDPRDVAVFSSSLQPRETATCDSLSCEHICIQNENGGTCVCSSGYQLAQDGRSCAQSVTSLWKNFVLSTESKVCSVPVNLLYSHPYIYNISQVISCFINGSNIQHLAVNSHNATLYYATRTSIHLYNTKTGNDIILFTGSKEIGGLAYDTVSGTLMWSEPDRIVGLLPNKSQFLVYGNLQNPRHITLYSRLGQIFWTERNSSSYFTTVFSGRIDGNATPQRIFSGIALTDLVYDETTNRLLCLDVDKIISMKANGEDMYTLPLSTTQTHSGLVAFRDYLVWMTSTTPIKLTFRDVDLLASSNNISFFLPGMSFVTDVVFYDASTQEESESACEVNNGNCNQICVIDGEGRQCLCNFGFHLSSDKVTCVTSYVKTDFFLVVDTLYGKTYQISNTGQVAALGSSQNAVPRHSTGYNPATGEIIWFDSQADAIKQLFFNGTSERVILSVKVPTSESRHIVSALCVDYSANTLYFAERKTDNKTGWIKVMSLKSHELRTLYTSTTPPRFLSISPQTGKLAFVDDAGEVYLDNMAMDSRMSLKSGLTDISGLVFANNGTSLLWSLEQTDEIVEMSLKTHFETKRLQKSGSYPYSLGVRGSYIYYLTHSQRSIRSLSPEGIETTVAEFPEFGILETLFVEDQDLAKYSTACSTKNGRCSTLCIPGGSNDHRCSCADSVELMDDKKTCRNVQRCMDPVSNGDISVICDRFPEEKCTYTCHEGFSSDHFEIQCGMSGKWVEQVDQLCQPKPSVPAVETTTSAAEVTTSHGHHDITCTESRMEFSIPLSSPHTSETATLSDPNCPINVTRTHVRGGVDLNSCGTTVQFQNDSVIFRNAIIFSAPESSSLGSSGSNDSVSQYQDIIPIQCVYNRIATVHLSYMPVVRRVLFTESGVGQFSFNIQQFWDASFTNMVSDRAYPLRMELDADVFIQLSVGSEGQPVAGHKEIGMEVQQCLVSPSSSVIEAQLHYYPLIQDGCPASSDVHIIPNTNASDSTVMRFRFRAVNFFDPSSSSSSSLVFVHCRMGLCLTGSCKPSAWSCLTPPARRVRRDVDQSKRAAHQLSTGPFLIMADEASTSSSSTTATVMAVVSTSVATVAIVIAAIALIALRRRRTTERN